MSAILFSRAIGPVPVDVIVREVHVSTLGITENPIETGARVTDHAYVEPFRYMLEFADANAAVTYNMLVRFQQTRVPFTIVSGLMVYKNMLIQQITAERDQQFSTVLSGRCELQEAILVSTASVKGSKAATKDATKGDDATDKRASGTVTRGDQPTTDVGSGKNQSLLSRITGSSGGTGMRESTGPGGMGGV